MDEKALAADLNALDLVVQDPIKFKIKLGIGEEAYATLKLAKTLQTLWELKGAAGTGAVAASSPLVATTFFGGSGGILSTLGFTAAATTPVGWVIAAAVVSGGAYYGAMKVAGSYQSSRVETIPKFINTPIDLLGATIFDMMAGLALKVVDFGGEIDDLERTAIIEYFIDEWGVSKDYATKALPLIESQITNTSLKEMVKTIADFQIDNPDCNPVAMKRDIKKFLEEIAFADGDLDEREELAMETIDRELNRHLAAHNQGLRTASKYLTKTNKAFGATASAITEQTSGVFKSIKERFKG